MSYMKTFNDVKVGDTIYYCVIKNSEIIQNCVGDIILNGYVTRTNRMLAANYIGLSINEVKYKFNEGYSKNEYKQEKITNAELALLPKNDNVYVVDESNEQNDNIFIEHLIIISTSKKAIAYKVAEIIDENNKKIENLTNLCHKAKQKSETMKLSASMRFNVAKYEEEEKEYTKEEIACMAL